MYHINMMARVPLVLAIIINVVAGEIDLLEDPGVINLDQGSLTYDYVMNDIDLLKEAPYDALHDDELLSAIELVQDDEVDVTVGDDEVGPDDGDIDLLQSLPGDDVSSNVVDDGEGPVEAGVVEPEVTKTTEKNVQTTRTTDPRLERFAEQLELITLPPEKRKRRKIELQLQKISVQNTEEQERKREERRQKRREKREKKKLEKLEKSKEKTNKIESKKDKKSKIQEMKSDSKKNVINLLEEINYGEDRVESYNFIKDKKWTNRKLNSFNIEKEKRSKKEDNNISIEKQSATTKNKKTGNSEEKKKKKEQKSIENIEKRKAKLLSKGKDHNLRILQNMIEEEERRLPSMNQSNNRNSKSIEINRNKVEYKRKKHDLKKWKSMKEKMAKRKKEIRFLLRLKRGFGARLDNGHKTEVAQQLMILKRKYSIGKEKLKDFQKNNWELIEESKLYSKLNRLKKKISYLKQKKKQYINTPNSNYVMKLSKRISYFRNKYQETKKKISLMGKFNGKFENQNAEYEKRNSHGYKLKRQEIKSKIRALRKIERQIENESDSEYKLKLDKKIKVLVEKYKRNRRRDKIRNETKKERKTRQLKDKIKRLEKKRKKGVNLVTETKLVKVREDLMKRYKTMRSITGYERRNKCYIREDYDSKNFLRMENIKEAIESLQNERKQLNPKIDSVHRTKIKNTIKRLSKSYREYKRLERIRFETKTERKNRKLREEILSLRKMKKQIKDENTKINLYKKIKKLVEKYKKTRKIIKYENKYECRYFQKSKKINEKLKILRVKRRQIDDKIDMKDKIRITNKIKHLIHLSRKYRKSERERNETENERKLWELKDEIKTFVKALRRTDDLNTKAKLATKVKKLKEKYKSLYLKVKYQSRNIDQVRKSYEKRTISKYYTRMENIKDKIKSLIKMKKQIRNEVDPRYKIKLNESIKKLIDMYKKYKRLEKMKTETRKEKKSRNLKEKIRSLKLKMSKIKNTESKEKISNVIHDMADRYKKIHNQVIYEKRNKCYLREDLSSNNYLKMEKLRDNIKLLINERKILGSDGDPKQKFNLKRKIRELMKKYKAYRKKAKINNETKNESKNRNLKEKIRNLIRLKKNTDDEIIKNNLSNKIKRLVKRYRRMRKVIKYENEYVCRYFNRVQKLKDKVKELVKRRKQISGDNDRQQKVILSKRITNLMKRYKKYKYMDKTRKQTENGRKIIKLKEEIKFLRMKRKNNLDLNEKEKLSKIISSLKNIYQKLKLIVRYEEKDMEQISRSYEMQIKSRHYVKMQKLKPKIISLKVEKRQTDNKDDIEYKLKLRKRVKSLIKRYKNHQRLIRKKYRITRKRTSSRNKHLSRRERSIHQIRKHFSHKNIYKLEDAAKRNRQQKKLRLRRRREKRGRQKKRGQHDSATKRNKSRLKSEDRGRDSVLPEGMAYCKSKESKSGGSCQCWYLQDQI